MTSLERTGVTGGEKKKNKNPLDRNKLLTGNRSRKWAKQFMNDYYKTETPNAMKTLLRSYSKINT